MWVRLRPPPPFFNWIDLAVADPVIQLGKPLGCRWQIHRGPAEGRFLEQSLQVPGASFHASSTHGARVVGHSITGALFDIRLPDFITVEHDLGTGRYCSGRALSCAFITIFAKIL